jgi:hypothetical protein
MSGKRRNTPTSVPRADFVRDPAAVMRMAERAGHPILITDARGKASAVVSAPRDERKAKR